jgi:cardiolipin synthase
VSVVDGHFDADLERSVRIEPGRWHRRSVVQQAAERVVAPVQRYF